MAMCVPKIFAIRQPALVHGVPMTEYRAMTMTPVRSMINADRDFVRGILFSATTIIVVRTILATHKQVVPI